MVSLEGTGTVEGVESGFYQVSHHALPPGTIVEEEPSIAPSVLALPSTTLSEAFAMDIDNDNDNGNSPLQGFISRDSRDSSQQWTPSMSRETSFSSLLHPLVHTLSIHPMNTPCQYTLPIHPVNTPHQPYMSTLFLNTSYHPPPSPLLSTIPHQPSQTPPNNPHPSSPSPLGTQKHPWNHPFV